jgi:hypothetical protein
MYYTPDGKYAIVVAEQERRLDFMNAADMTLHHSLPVPCKGVNHMDVSADGRYLIANCEPAHAVSNKSTQPSMHLLRRHTPGMWLPSHKSFMGRSRL